MIPIFVLVSRATALIASYSGDVISAFQSGIYVILSTHTIIQDPKDVLPVKSPWVWLDEGDIIDFKDISFEFTSDTIETANMLDLSVLSLPQMVDALDPISRIAIELPTSNGPAPVKLKDPFSAAYFRQPIKPKEMVSTTFIAPVSQLYFVVLVSPVLYTPSTWKAQFMWQTIELHGEIASGTPDHSAMGIDELYQPVTMLDHLPAPLRGLETHLSWLSFLSFAFALWILSGSFIWDLWDTAIGFSRIFLWTKSKVTLPQASGAFGSRYRSQSLELHLWSIPFFLRASYYSLGAAQLRMLSRTGTLSYASWVVPRLLSMMEDVVCLGTLVFLGTTSRSYSLLLKPKELNTFFSLFMLYLYFSMYEAVAGTQFVIKRMLQAVIILFLLIFDNLRYYGYSLRLEQSALLEDSRILNDYRMQHFYNIFKYMALLYIVKSSIVMCVASLTNADSWIVPQDTIRSNQAKIEFGNIGPSIMFDNWKMVFLDLMIMFGIAWSAIEARCMETKELNPLDSQYSYLVNKHTTENAHTMPESTEDPSDPTAIWAE